MDTDFKRVWAVDTDNAIFLVTPLEPVMYRYVNGKYQSQIVVKIPWTSWQTPFLLSGEKDFVAYMRRFNRVSYFGIIDQGFLMTIENMDGITTQALLLAKDSKVLKSVSIQGWDGEGKVLTGSDGSNPWVFDPELFTVRTLTF